MPTSIQAVIVITLFLMPGFMARRVLSWAYPTSEPGEADLALTTITLSCVNYGIWSWLLVLSWQKHWYKSDGFLALPAVFISFSLAGRWDVRHRQTHADQRLSQGPRDFWHSASDPKSLGLFLRQRSSLLDYRNPEKWPGDRRILRHRIILFLVPA